MRTNQEAVLLALLCMQLDVLACATTPGLRSDAPFAAEHDRLARAEESRACPGIPDQVRDGGPFDHPEELEGVDILNLPIAAASGGGRTNGASIRLRAAPGMTAEWLQRVTDCHLAHHVVTGDALREMRDCPLDVKGVTATVTSTGRGFAIDIRSEDVETANEIVTRARALLIARQ